MDKIKGEPRKKLMLTRETVQQFGVRTGVRAGRPPQSFASNQLPGVGGLENSYRDNSLEAPP